MSKKLNLLALPKEKAFMKCFIAPSGMNLIQGDVAALEPNVLTHFSQDPTLLTVYGKDAWVGHDIYLIAGMSVPGMGEEISAIYDINNPTTESVPWQRRPFPRNENNSRPVTLVGSTVSALRSWLPGWRSHTTKPHESSRGSTNASPG